MQPENQEAPRADKPWSRPVIAVFILAIAAYFGRRTVDAIPAYIESPWMVLRDAIPFILLLLIAALLVRERLIATAKAFAGWINSKLGLRIPRIRGVPVVLALITLVIGHLTLTQLSIQRAFKCYVEPRRLTEDQINAISEYLLEHAPHELTLTYQSNDGEVSRLAFDIERTFEGGNWRIIHNPVNPAGEATSLLSRSIDYDDITGATVSATYGRIQSALRPGLNYRWESNEETQLRDSERRPQAERNPGELATQAFQMVGHVTTSGSTRQNNDLGFDEYSVEVSIGPRPYTVCQDDDE